MSASSSSTKYLKTRGFSFGIVPRLRVSAKPGATALAVAGETATDDAPRSAPPPRSGTRTSNERAQPEARASRRSYEDVLERLSAASVRKHFDAYADIPWDDPSFSIARDDRWAYHNWTVDPLASTRWYRDLPAAKQVWLGLHVAATFAKIGIQFESILQRGLLAYAERLPNGSPEFRYAYHEIIEEGQHSLMFQEFINRSGQDVSGMPVMVRRVGDRVTSISNAFPELFFLYVLGGEEPIDYLQREALRRRDHLPPLMRRMSEIHVTEEARHISFARAYLRERVPSLSPEKKLFLAVSTPMLFGTMTPLMLRPSESTVRRLSIPKVAWEQAYANNPEYRSHLERATRKVRALCIELDLMPSAAELLWRHYDMWSS